ncbi:MAG: formate dehydrogenase subunit beta, partial [Gammaproteobacteria bacterium]
WALALMGLTALAGFFHFVRIGRNRIEDSDEAAAQQALEAARRSAPPGSGGTREKRP